MQSLTICAGEHDVPGINMPRAIVLAPQSIDLGQTVTWTPVCPAHLSGWWDGADAHPFIPFAPIPGVEVPAGEYEAYLRSWYENAVAQGYPLANS